MAWEEVIFLKSPDRGALLQGKAPDFGNISTLIQEGVRRTSSGSLVCQTD